MHHCSCIACNRLFTARHFISRVRCRLSHPPLPLALTLFLPQPLPAYSATPARPPSLPWPLCTPRSPYGAQEERTSSLIPTRDALALEAAELRKFTPTKPLAEIKDEIKTEVAARRKKEGEVRRVKEKITTINARVRQLASQKRAPLPAEMQSAVKTLGSVEITAQQSGLLTKQMAESGAQQGWLPS